MMLFRRHYDALNNYLAGWPDFALSLALWAAALFIVLAALKAPPAAKPALLAFILLP